MKPTHMLRVLDTCKYQVSREGYSKPSAGGNGGDTVPEGQEVLTRVCGPRCSHSNGSEKSDQNN